jgi:hypothetical protein
MLRLLSFALLVGLPLTASAQNNFRFQQFTKKFEKTPDQAKVVSAGYLGTAGTEWLVGGGFQDDGTVVVVGTSLGPTLDFSNVKTLVFGKDAPAPEEYKPLPVLGKDGQPEKNKDGVIKYKDPAWTHPNATAFVVRLSADLKTVKSVSRFPWKSGGATSAAVDKDGNIYIAGPATEAIANVGGDVGELKSAEGSGEKGAVQQTFVAKLNADASKLLWVRHLKAPTNAPEVTATNDGKVRFVSADMRTLDANGKQEAVVVVPGGLGNRVAINPKDGTFAKGGETRNWNTGREPYRDPILNIHNPNGKLKYELYHWDGPLVGLDNLRLVSDSVVRAVRYDSEGNLVIYAWSDGGNSVMYREPFDVRTMAKEFKGLGMSAYGAGVLSCAYIIKIDTKTYKVSGGTLWLAFLGDKDKPNSIWIDSLDFATDGSILAGGKSASGLIQTGNKLTDADPAGPYVAVFNKDCTSLRFSSALPGTAKADLGEGVRWGFVKGTVKGKPMVLALGSGEDKVEHYGKMLSAPATGNGQAKFAGGALDGYMLLLDLGKE